MVDFYAMGGLGAYSYRSAAAMTPARTSSLAPVEPAPAVDAVYNGRRAHMFTGPFQPAKMLQPGVRMTDETVAMSVRGRMRNVSAEELGQLAASGKAQGSQMPAEAVTGELGQSAVSGKTEGARPAAAAAAEQLGRQVSASGEAQEAKTPAEVMEESECQTCANRKYQDGSDDPGVSFKTPTKISADEAAYAVRSHEMEHVTREQAKAQREGKEVVQQSVVLHTSICPDCGQPYVSGGTTTTTTMTKPQEEQEAEEAEKPMLDAVA